MREISVIHFRENWTVEWTQTLTGPLSSKTTHVRNKALMTETCMILRMINPLKAKRRLFYLNTQFLPRSKHFSSRL